MSISRFFFKIMKINKHLEEEPGEKKETYDRGTLES